MRKREQLSEKESLEHVRVREGERGGGRRFKWCLKGGPTVKLTVGSR